jgi:hypothetical protein
MKNGYELKALIQELGGQQLPAELNSNPTEVIHEI